MKKVKECIFLFIIILFAILTIIIFIRPNKRLKADISSNVSDYTDIKVATFNIGSWNCGNGSASVTCNHNNNQDISELFKSLNLDLVGIQEGATYDNNGNPLSTNINELATLSNLNLKFITPYQINALLSKYTFNTLTQDEEYKEMTKCIYTHNNYTEDRAILKEIVKINDIDISVYVAHIALANCNSIHFNDLVNIISQDSNPIILMGDFNDTKIDGYNTYLKPLGFSIAAYDTNYRNAGTISYADAIFVKSNGMIEIKNSDFVTAFGIYSDHNLVISNLRVSKKKIDVPTCPNKTYTGERQILMDDTDGYILNRAKRKATPAGSYEVELILNNGYIWSDNTTNNKNITCTINPYNISNAVITNINNQMYTGSAITPTPTVTALNSTLVEGTDYTLSYSNNINVGTATITVTGKGNYTGTKTTTFNILSSNIDVSSLSFKNNVLALNKNSTKKTITDKIGTTGVKVLNGNTEIGTNDKIKTGYILNVNNTNYSIAIIGDTNKTGTVDMQDVSQIYSHVRNKTKYPLDDVQKAAADTNNNGTVELQDVAKLYTEYRQSLQ